MEQHPAFHDQGRHYLQPVVPGNNSKGLHLMEDRKRIHVNILQEIPRLEYIHFAINIMFEKSDHHRPSNNKNLLIELYIFLLFFSFSYL